MNMRRLSLLLLFIALTANAQVRDGSHDFDFEIGTWKTHLKRRVANQWVEMDGTTVVRKVLNGHANLVELDVAGATGRLQGLSLRLYDPTTGQWSLNYANAASGTLSEPSIGGFKNGRGEFYDHEVIDGQPVFVRFVISDITANSVHFEQAISADGGKTWEPNWIADDTRISESAFALTSSTFASNATMPDRTVLNGLDCHQENKSPALKWTGAPAATKSYVIICDDYEAREGDGFIHWAAYNIPGSVTSLAENAGAAEGDLTGGGRHAYNDFLRRRYDGPCPPEGPPHKYRFTVYALDMPTIDDAGTPMTWRKLRVIIRDHVLAQTSLIGLRGH